MSQVQKVVKKIVESGAPGAILVFLPGVQEIEECMQQSLPNTRSLRLYGRQNDADRQAVFETCTDAIKIIYSTDIAEEALT